jgi:hypothetical protein
MPAVARILARFDRERLAGFIEVAIGLLDVMEPDPDSEDSETGSSLVDDRGKFLGDDYTASKFDDDCEPDDPDEDGDMDCCMAGDDLARSGPIVLDRHWAWEVSSGRQPGDADEHEPWQASRETQDHRD